MTIPVCTPLAKDVRPTHLTLTTLNRELNDYAMAQKSGRGGGNHGYLALLMTPAAYLALTTHAFDVPLYPGENPVHPPGANGPIITECNRAHLVNLTQFNAYRDVEMALKEMILTAVPKTFIHVLEDQLYGFSQVSTLQILTHLNTTYGKVTNQDLANNLEQMNRQWDPSALLEDLWTQIQVARNYAATTSAITDTNAVLAAEKNLLNSGVFNDAFDHWRIKLSADQTYENLMIHFNNADINRLHKKTIADAGYAATQTPAINSNANNQNAGSLKGWHYCWSHGINMTHKGANCRNPKEGHIHAATILNLQGGANTIYTPVIRTDGRGGGRGGRGRGRGDGRGRGQPIIAPVIE